MSRMERPKAMSLTDAAAARVKEIMAQRETPAVGLRVGVKARGCSGLSYFVEYADAKKPFEEVVEEKGVTLLLDPASTMFLLGTEMDYQEDKFQSGFVFTNPNEKGRCGCGESFTV
ncbi:HesB/IscA family protein [Nitrospirillum viridazoti]|uniref:Fe-S cluster assembly scaffold SufA n=1 Tax=Nitrospirillum viridazoti CBAmc TaxID=1441467 RepID=A0A248JMR3_9PROT|nr:iron-sulfur cluster assembly accessory protein [Nitrospirillum amazonense]ASG19997.1 Fe-S cluster assembly scaffold SufA [Nitrospirillum amazonense CBAmc]TWB36314.1 iron-sulfur cluster assembly protein [Nitrospirillum amazonense]